MLGDEAEDSVVMPEPGPGIDADMAQLPQDHLLGGYKRPRVATSLSSTGGDSVDDLRFLSNSEGLVNGFLSLELSQLINQPGVRPREIPGPHPQSIRCRGPRPHAIIRCPGPHPHAIIRCRACSSLVQPGAARCGPVTPGDACWRLLQPVPSLQDDDALCARALPPFGRHRRRTGNSRRATARRTRPKQRPHRSIRRARTPPRSLSSWLRLS